MEQNYINWLLYNVHLINLKTILATLYEQDNPLSSVSLELCYYC